MPVNWDEYTSFLVSKGTSFSDRAVQVARERLSAGFLESPAKKNFTLGSKTIPFIVTATQDVAIKKAYTLLSYKNDFGVGDVITFSNQHWLVTEIDFDQSIHIQARLEWCNILLRFQNWTSTVLEYWGIMKSPSSSSIDDTDRISTPESKYTFMLPLNINTEKLYVGKRLVADIAYDSSGKQIPVVYRITHIDKVSNNYGFGSLLKIYADYDEHRETDSVIHRIADYIPNIGGQEQPEIPEDKLLCQIVGRNTVLLGLSRKYTSVFYEADGVTVSSGITPIWNVAFEEGLAEFATVSIADGTLQISIPNRTELIGKKYTITLSENSGNYVPNVLSGMVVT